MTLDHDKCYDSPDTFCLRATITETKNAYFTEPENKSTIILKFPERLTVSILSGELVTNTFDLDINKMTFLDEQTTEKQSTIDRDSPVDVIPLYSWNDGNSRQQILDFVFDITFHSSSKFVPAVDRIAVFDNDGTLWIEQPLYIPFAYHLEYLYEQLENDPSLSSQSPYSEILEKKIPYLMKF